MPSLSSEPRRRPQQPTMALSSDADSVGSNVSPPHLIAIEFQAPPHDSACDPSNPSEADTSDRDAVQEPEPDVDTQDEGASPVQGTKVKDREHEKAKLIEWASSLTIKDVVLTKDGLDVETLGVRMWSELKCYVKLAFIQANKIAIAQAHCKNNDLGKNVANKLNCRGYKHKIKSSVATKQSSTTKPDVIKVDCTLFRMVNVIIRGKEQYIALKESHDKDDLDSRNPKAAAWQVLYLHYS